MSETQPDKVATEETPRAPDKSVVTDETQPGGLAEPAAASDQAGPNQGDSAPPDDKPKPRRNRAAERKLRKLSRDLKASEQTNAELKAQVQDLTTKVETLANPKPAEPKFEDFDSPQDYAKAYAKWEGAAAPKPPEPPKPAAKAPDPTPQPPSKELQSFIDAGTNKFGDQFNEAMQDASAAISPVMGDFLLDSDVGPDLYLHLVDNPDLAREIADKSPVAAVKRLEKIEKEAKAGKLEVDDGELRNVQTEEPVKTEEPKAPPVASKAPEPPKDQDDRGTMTIKADPENESMDEYAARRRKEMAAAGYR